MPEGFISGFAFINHRLKTRDVWHLWENNPVWHTDNCESEVGRFTDRHRDPLQATWSYSQSPAPTTSRNSKLHTTRPTALLCSGAGDKSSPWTQKAALEAPDLHQLPDFSYHCTRSSAQSHQGHLSRHQVPLQITTELQKGVSLVSDQSTINPLSCMFPFLCFHIHFPAEKMVLSQSAPI